MSDDHRIRQARPADAESCAAIYAPYVLETTVSFEEEPPTAGEMAQRMITATEWLVVEQDGKVTGYAYARPFAARPAYRWSCEVSVYLEVGRRRRGNGRALYGELLESLERSGYRQVLAGIAMPNEASVGLHEAMGFRRAGLYQDVGYKHGGWRSVAWFQRALGPGASDSTPPEPVSQSRIVTRSGVGPVTGEFAPR